MENVKALKIMFAMSSIPLPTHRKSAQSFLQPESLTMYVFCFFVAVSDLENLTILSKIIKTVLTKVRKSDT